MKIKQLKKTAVAGFISFGIAFTGVGISAPAFASAPDGNQSSAQSAKVSTQSTNLNLAAPIQAKKYRVSSHYGNRCAPVIGASFFHGAVDMAAPDGTPLYAVLDGTIDSVVQGSSTTTGTIRVDHGIVNGKKLLVSYGHMWDVYKYVKVGQKVKKGQQISEVGSSGVSTGAHLHLAVQYGGKWVDPVPLLKSFGLDLHKNATSVVANNNPTVCYNMHVSADMGLKQSASSTSATIAILKRNSILTVTPGPSVAGYIKVKDNKSGKTGYLLGNTINKKSTSSPYFPPSTTVSSDVNKRYTTKSTQHIRSYPSTEIGKSGILDTAQKGRIMTTTGKRSGSYSEVKFNLGTGWILTSALLYAPDPATISGTKSVAKNVLYTPNLSVNLFSYPDSSANIYREYAINLKKGAEIRTTGRELGVFTEVTYNNKKYWAHKSYIHRTTPAMPKTSSTTKNVSYKAKATTSLRNYPSSDSTISWGLLNIPKNGTVKTTGKKYSSWMEVTYSGKTGWITTSQATRQAAALPKLSNTTANVPYKVKVSSSQMRNYPSTSEVQGWNLRTIKKNTLVKTTGKKYGSYLQVKYSTTTGWVPTSQLTRQVASLPKVSNTTKNVSYKVKVSSAQIRNYPSTSETQGWNLKTIKKNTVVKTVGKKYGSYIQVKSGSTTGWVSTSKLSRQVAKLPKVSNTSKNVYYKTKYNSVQMRNYPSTSEVQGWNLKTLKKNSKITTTGKKYGSYIQMKSGSTVGWVKTSQITRTTANLPKLSNTKKNVTYKAKSTQKIMNYPSSSTAKGWNLKTIKKNYKVKTVGKRTGSWYQVKYGKTTGWVYIKNFKR